MVPSNSPPRANTFLKVMMIKVPTPDPLSPVPGQRASLLEVDELSRAFSGVVALQGYSLRLDALTIHGVIGPNGAGKTTLFNLLTGFLLPTKGAIRFAEQDITGRPAYQIARLGIARTFQNIRLFGQLSAIENVKTALQGRTPNSLLATLFSTPSLLRRERDLEAGSMRLLPRRRRPPPRPHRP